MRPLVFGFWMLVRLECSRHRLRVGRFSSGFVRIGELMIDVRLVILFLSFLFILSTIAGIVISVLFSMIFMNNPICNSLLNNFAVIWVHMKNYLTYQLNQNYTWMILAVIFLLHYASSHFLCLNQYSIISSFFLAIRFIRICCFISWRQWNIDFCRLIFIFFRLSSFFLVSLICPIKFYIINRMLSNHMTILLFSILHRNKIMGKCRVCA